MTDIATITSIDDSVTFSFLINPESLEFSHSASYAQLPVLGTAQPLLSYQSSRSSFSVPSAKLWTTNNEGDLTIPLDTLASWSKSSKVLKFTWGSLVYPRLVLVDLKTKIYQWRNGKPSQATCSLGFLESPSVPEPTVEPVIRLSEREQTDYLAKLVEAAKTEPVKSRVAQQPSEVLRVTSDGQVTGTLGTVTRTIGALSDFLELPRGLGTLKK